MRIPDDFPREPGQSGTAGNRSSTTRSRRTKGAGAGAELERLHVRFRECRQLADRVIAKAVEKRETVYAQYSESEFLAGILAWLQAERYGTDAEMRWVIRETARTLQWQPPNVALY